MKTMRQFAIGCLLVLFAIAGIGSREALAQPGVNVSFRAFYEELAPYGDWVTHPAYGSVWVPNAGPDFRPYGTRGYWVMTEYGNTWVSDYAWGWAPFHYGRWFLDDYYGWSWVPGYEWGPAWVAWRSGGGYYGWAPLTPDADIFVTTAIPAPYWVFVPHGYITHPQPYRYCVPRPQVIHVYQRTVYVHNTYRNHNRVYVCGPYRDDIRRTTHRQVPLYRIQEADRPGRSVARNGAVEVYRPRIPNDTGDNQPSFASERYAREENSNWRSERPERRTPTYGRTRTEPDPDLRGNRVGTERPAPVEPEYSRRPNRSESNPEPNPYSEGRRAPERDSPAPPRRETPGYRPDYPARPSREAPQNNQPERSESVPQPARRASGESQVRPQRQREATETPDQTPAPNGRGYGRPRRE